MKKVFTAIAPLLLASFSAYAQDASNAHVHHLTESNTFAQQGRDWAKAQLDKSPRRFRAQSA